MSKAGLLKETNEADQSLTEAQVSVGSNNKQCKMHVDEETRFFCGGNNKQCKMHVDEETRFFCEDCDDFICDECVQSVHKTHDFVSFKNMVNKFLETELTNIESVCKGEKELVSELKKRIDEPYDTLIEKIESHASDLTQVINELKEMKIKKIQEVRQKEYIAASKFASFLKESVGPTAEQILSLTQKPDKTLLPYRQIITLIVRYKTMIENMKTNEDERLDEHGYEAYFTPGTTDKTNLGKIFGNLTVKSYPLRDKI